MKLSIILFYFFSVLTSLATTKIQPKEQSCKMTIRSLSKEIWCCTGDKNQNTQTIVDGGILSYLDKDDAIKILTASKALQDIFFEMGVMQNIFDINNTLILTPRILKKFKNFQKFKDITQLILLKFDFNKKTFFSTPTKTTKLLHRLLTNCLKTKNLNISLAQCSNLVKFFEKTGHIDCKNCLKEYKNSFRNKEKNIKVFCEKHYSPIIADLYMNQCFLNYNFIECPYTLKEFFNKTINIITEDKKLASTFMKSEFKHYTFFKNVFFISTFDKLQIQPTKTNFEIHKITVSQENEETVENYHAKKIIEYTVKNSNRKNLFKCFDCLKKKDILDEIISEDIIKEKETEKTDSSYEQSYRNIYIDKELKAYNNTSAKNHSKTFCKILTNGIKINK